MALRKNNALSQVSFVEKYILISVVLLLLFSLSYIFLSLYEADAQQFFAGPNVKIASPVRFPYPHQPSLEINDPVFKIKLFLFATILSFLDPVITFNMRPLRSKRTSIFPRRSIVSRE